MSKKRRSKRSMSKYIMLIIVIASLNFMGISYAAWTDNLNINATIKTGEINPVIVNGNQEKNIDFGEISLAPGQKETLDLTVKNKGTLPVKADAIEKTLKDGLKIRINQHHVEPGEEVKVPVELIAGEEMDSGKTYKFSEKIIYKQFNFK